MKRTIIIITGMPGCGKTTLANKLNDNLWENNIDGVLLSKDKIHETLADIIGKKSNDNFRYLVLDTYKRFINFCINRKDDIIILESPFSEDKWLDYFKMLHEKYGIGQDDENGIYQFITIHVKCDSFEELYNRADNRLKLLDRHPAHYRYEYNKRLKDKYRGTMEEDMGDLTTYKELYDNETFTKLSLGVTLEYKGDNLSELLNKVNDLIGIEHF